MYERFQVLDITIEDETQRNGREITFYVDTLQKVNIEIGNSVTIRTDEAGVEDLRDALDRALDKLEDIRREAVCEKMDELTDELQRSPPVADRVLTPTQTHDLWAGIDAEVNSG